MARAPATTIDTQYDEFQPPRPPIEGGGVDPYRRRYQRTEVTPFEEGFRYGRNRVEITAKILQNHVERWQAALLSKLSTINGEIKELDSRRKSPWLILTLIFGILFGVAGFLIAIAVDYYIVRDFWNGIYANEYGEVPASAGISPLVKALQVVVAALMFHFLYQYLGRTGKRVFVYVMGILTIILLLGVGLWVANDNLPPGFRMFGVQLSEEAAVRDTTLEDLGLAPATPAPKPEQNAGTPANEAGKEAVSNTLGVIWFLAFGMIFIVVTGVAALSLGVATRAAGGLFGSIDREIYDGRAMNRQDVVFRLARARQAKANLVDPQYRMKLLRAYLGEFLDGYVDGLGRHSNSKQLLESFHEAAANAFDEVDMDRWDWVTDHEEDYRRGSDGERPRRGKPNGRDREEEEREDQPIPDPETFRKDKDGDDARGGRPVH